MIDLAKRSQPVLVHSYITSLETVITTINAASEDLRAAQKSALAGSGGQTGAAIDQALTNRIKNLDDMVDNLGIYKAALSRFAFGMQGVYGRLDDIYDAAINADLPYGVDRIYLPDPSDTVKTAVYKQLASTARLDRLSEAQVHEDFKSDCAKLSNPVEEFLKTFGKQFIPPKDREFFPWILDVAGELDHLQYAGFAAAFRFAPRFSANTVINKINGGGQFCKVSSLNPLQKILKSTNPKNYVPKPNTAKNWIPKGVGNLTKAAPVLKLFGRAATGLSAAYTAWDQYQKDSLNPSMGEVEKIARVTTKTTTTVVTTLAAAKSGSTLGMAIGSFGGPIGIFAGGIVGGVIGGIVGSSLGEAIGDGLNSVISALKFW